MSLWLLASPPLVRAGRGARWLAGAVGLDPAHRRLPNRWMLGGALLALVLAALPGGIGLPAALQGGLIALLVFLPGFVLHRLGAGDVKLMAVCGLFAGSPAVWGLCLAVMLAGGVQALLWLGRSRWQAWRATAPGAAGVVSAAETTVSGGLSTSSGTAATCAPQPLPAAAPARPMPYAWAVAGGVLLHALTGPWTGA